MLTQARERLENRRGRPLDGRRIAVTRPASQARKLVKGLRELGASPLECPTIRIEPPEDPDPLEHAVADLRAYGWVVFTSANGVARFWKALTGGGGDARRLAGLRVAAIGPATAAALRRRGIRPDLVPEEYVAEAVADAMVRQGDVEGRRILLPRAGGARAVLPERLAAAGAEVDEVVAYRSVPDRAGIARLQAAIERDEVDMVTFTASSTVRNFVDVAGPEIGRARVAAIGPVTAGTARDMGLRVDVVASDYTVDGLLTAISEHYEGVGREA